jgi:hypothetical protein
MNNKTKLRVLLIFVVVLVGGGFLLATLIPETGIKKTGYKTKVNPSYIEDKLQEKKDSLRKTRK